MNRIGVLVAVGGALGMSVLLVDTLHEKATGGRGTPDTADERTSTADDRPAPSAGLRPAIGPRKKAGAASGDKAEPAEEAARPAGAAPQPGEIVAPASRDVTPPGVTRGPQVTGPLVRVAPAAPQIPAEPPPPREPVRLFGVHVTAEGRIGAAETEFGLAGITLAAPDTLCGEGATRWPCGRMAVAQLRRLIGGRAINCDRDIRGNGPPDPARCRLANIDLSEWMVAQGWARASGSTLADLEARARADTRGLWSPERP